MKWFIIRTWSQSGYGIQKLQKKEQNMKKWKSKLEARFRTCLSQTGAKLTSNLDMDREAPPSLVKF